jgi:hypothetical protein
MRTFIELNEKREEKNDSFSFPCDPAQGTQ